MKKQQFELMFIFWSYFIQLVLANITEMCFLFAHKTR